MRIFFVTDRADAHVARFGALFGGISSSYSLATVTYSPKGIPSASFGEHLVEGWGQIRAFLETEKALVISGPLDTVTSELAGGKYHHIGISWATDVMVTAASGFPELESLQSTVLGLDLVVTDNYATENALVGLGVHANKVLRIPWGPEAASSDPDGPEQGDARRLVTRADFGLPVGRKIILYPRSLEALYQPEVFVEAIALVAKAHPEVLALCVEAGSMVAEIKKQIEGLSVAEFFAWQPARPPAGFQGLLAVSDAVVVTPRTDGTSVTVMEAMQARIPVVSSLTSGSSEWIIQGVTGWSFPVGSAEALAAAIVSLLEATEEHRGLIVANAHRLVTARAGWSASSLRFADAIRSLSP